MSQDLHKIYAQGPLQDLGQGLQPRSSKKDLYAPSMNFPQDRHIRILREVSKISWPGSLRIRESDPRAKARGICRAQTDGEVARWIRRWEPRRKESDLGAQSDERVARKISKRAPCHRESDLTRTEWGKGCAWAMSKWGPQMNEPGLYGFTGLFPPLRTPRCGHAVWGKWGIIKSSG